MSDAAQLAIWLGVLGGGLLFCVAAKAAGLATTHVRDLLHVGASLWVFGWPLFRAPTWPIAITLVSAASVAALPAFAGRSRALSRLRESVSGGDEKWTGLTIYALSFAAFTTLGFLDAMGPAAAALLALAWGDGVGGFVGRRYGRVRYRVPGAKEKSLEGSLAVLLFATAGVVAAGRWLHAPYPIGLAVIAGVAAAVAEALAPRASDNALLPLAVWLVLRFS